MIFNPLEWLRVLASGDLRSLTERQREVLSILVENKLYRGKDTAIPEIAEQLGIAFYEQGQYGIAEAVLRRANSLNGPDDEKIGILYWFGRALEAQGKTAEALPLYEQAAALDIRFLDVRERARRLGERGER